MSILIRSFALISALASNCRSSHRYEHLFSLSDFELNARGLDREHLVRGFITGFAYG